MGELRLHGEIQGLYATYTQRVDIFVESPARVENILRVWNSDLWSYQVAGIEPAAWTDIPKGTKVYRGPCETFVYR